MENTESMVLAEGRDGIKRMLIYQETILLVDKEDFITFVIKNKFLDYTIRFSFSQAGEKYSTNYWEKIEEGYLHYQLNNWDSSTYVEISKPVILKVNNESSLFWMKFRNQSLKEKSQRKFEISIWKEVKDGE